MRLRTSGALRAILEFKTQSRSHAAVPLSEGYRLAGEVRKIRSQAVAATGSFSVFLTAPPIYNRIVIGAWCGRVIVTVTMFQLGHRRNCRRRSVVASP